MQIYEKNKCSSANPHRQIRVDIKPYKGKIWSVASIWLITGG